jgi:ubiquinone/menaquinone biosynthesis C-methylase UbiE
MGDELRFAADLYHGAAGHYDRYRLPYPGATTGELIQRAEVSGDGRLLDLACGTGQLAFPLRQWFSEVWAVDREPDMLHVVRAKAEALGAGNIRPVVADAETQSRNRVPITGTNRPRRGNPAAKDCLAR